MPLPEKYRPKWEAEISKALTIYANGLVDASEMIETEYSDGSIDVDAIWEYFEDGNLRVVSTLSPKLLTYLDEALRLKYLALQSSAARVASRHLEKFG